MCVSGVEKKHSSKFIRSNYEQIKNMFTEYENDFLYEYLTISGVDGVLFSNADLCTLLPSPGYSLSFPHYYFSFHPSYWNRYLLRWYVYFFFSHMRVCAFFPCMNFSDIRIKKCQTRFLCVRSVKKSSVVIKNINWAKTEIHIRNFIRVVLIPCIFCLKIKCHSSVTSIRSKL